jgi:DNA-binding transcriptional LysR family regulator
VDLRHTRTFVTVAELGTVSKAALRLRIAQPALSRQISDLEQELGVKLFDRVGRRLLLTGEGEQLLSDCRGLLNYASAIGERAQLLRHGDTGVLKVAASSQNLESVIANFLHHYARRYPKVEVRLFDAIGPELLEMLERGEIHVGQSSLHVIQRDHRRFGSLPLAPVEVLAACHPRLALGKGKTVEIGQLGPYPLLLQDPAFMLRRVFDAAGRLAGLKPNILLESRAPHTLLAMAEAGHGVAIFPSALQTFHRNLRIVAVTYRGKPLRWPLMMLWDRRRPLPQYATVFCEMLGEYYREVFPITRPTEPTSHATAKRSTARRAHASRTG